MRVGRFTLATATCVVVTALTSCRSSDQIDRLEADHPHDVRATAACQEFIGRNEGDLLASADSTLGFARTHIPNAAHSDSLSQGLSTWDDLPDTTYLALCEVRDPSPHRFEPTPAPVLPPLVLGVLDNGGSFYVDAGR